ncbi:MAG: helix-turn-helix domain-containing protein, partial [Myxococcota bacterium]
ERAGERRRGLCISNEASLAALLTIAREVSGTLLRPTAVFFKHPEPPQSDPQRRFFEAPVHFASDRDALVFDPQTTATQNRLGDEAIARFFDRHLEGQRAAADWETTLEAQVRAQISQALSDGVPKISHIGARLQMSGRTLQRRLSDSGLSFQTLVDEARHDLAKRLLKHTEYSLAEISFLTGFSEQSAFNRAFKRWQGQTPRSFRLGPTR